MKAKLRLLEVGLLTMVIVLDAYLYLMNSNLRGSEYKAKLTNSTANYVDVGSIKNIDELNQEEKEVKDNSSKEIVKVNSDKTVEKEAEKVVPAIVYDGLTLDQLSNKINKSLNSTVSGKGYLIASYALEKGVDPYLATAIMLHETGCRNECSRLVKECNNVGGQKGKGCGSYSYFNSLDEGITAFIDNIYRNYVRYGLLTPEAMNSKYAADKNWSVNVNKYIEIIKAL